jgi:glucokinase
MLDHAAISALRGWRRFPSLEYCVGLDVGGSGIRFRVANLAFPDESVDLPLVAAQSAREFDAAVSLFASSMRSAFPAARCGASSFALAGLRCGDTWTVLSWPDRGESRTIDLSRVALCPRRNLVLLNDLEASARGIMAARGAAGEYFEQLCGPRWPVVSATANTAVMAAGSGLGAAVFAAARGAGARVVVPTEMGWCLAAGVGPAHPESADSEALFEWTAARSYGGRLRPVYEDMTSGYGLVRNYSYLMQSDQAVDAERVVAQAKNGDRASREAVAMYYRWYTRCAQQLAIGFRCDSVLMALSHQVANRSLIQQIKPELARVMNDHARPEWTKEIRLFSQMKECNFNLLGAIAAALEAAKAA